MNRSIVFISGLVLICLTAIIVLKQELLKVAFSWLLANPFIPVSAALALWAIISLLGDKNLRRATWLELFAVGMLFHHEFSAFFRSILDSFLVLWRGV